MKRYIIASLLLGLAAVIVLVNPQRFLRGGDTQGQKRPVRRPATPAPTGPGAKDYSKFSHATKEHTEGCKTCHKIPTANSQKVRAFPDVADFPDHEACVRCHRSQFFKGAQPVICTVCHTKVSAKDDTRLAFRNPARFQQFKIRFPHDKHQDVIASLQRGSRVGWLRERSLVKSAHAIADNKTRYNNCEICHDAATKPAVAPAPGWTDSYAPPVDTFKLSPGNHASCFNCHWSKQKPTADDCAGCHTNAPTPFTPRSVPMRISMKFRHDGGGEKKNHLAECTTCHINITKSGTLEGLTADVPIYPSCATSSCHGPVLAEEMSKFNKGNFKCSKCHTSDVGGRKPSTNSHEQALLGQ